ncbi:MAG: adenylosuccinate synthase [Oscillospiraceae bacterium]|jgi:adenylosuccinate synthase|nr:adenylosuccinate synthase [Oscillospiraceae bacterium]
MITAVVGINWGDEGKGRMVDLLCAGYDIVARYQGGNNAGHTVVNDMGKFALNLIPCGIFRAGIVNVLGTGMVIDPEHLWNEIETLRARGAEITPDNLKVSEKAIICMPYHRTLDVLEEDRLGANAQGSTRRGIAPVYSDKYHRKALRVGDALRADTLRGKVETVAGFKSVLMSGYGAGSVSVGDTLAWLGEFVGRLAPFVTNTESYLESAASDGKNIMLEAQLGTLRDIDFGIYPYTTSSTTLAAYGPIGAGIPGRRLDRVVGVMKAYSSSVGGGPFTVEMSGAEADALREAGGEYGTATGRPRRVGAFDCVASRFGVKMQGADTLALTKFDVLSYMERIPVCVAYDIGGARVTDFPTGDELEAAKPVYEYLPGFGTDISGCRSAAELPSAARDYIGFIENAVGARIQYVSVGPGRDDYFIKCEV